MIDRTNVAALIPAFREQMHIADVVRRAKEHLDVVLVIDDGSPDATSTEAGKAGAKVIRHEANRGKGAAIKTGLRELLSYGVKYVLILDGDGQHRPEEIAAFLEEANRSGIPFLLGNRMSDARKMPPVRRLTNRFMSLSLIHI